jgi:aldehyde:ferredoxin oxidoreductase
MIAERRGIGDALADGVALAARRIGKGAEKVAVHAGGQEPGMHDGRMDPMMAVSFAADPTPGRHTISAGVYYNVSHLWEFVSWAPPVTRPYSKSREYVPSDEEARKSVAGACVKQLLDATGGCLFALTTGLQHWRLFDWMNAATGEDRTPDEWMKAGRRIQTARAAFGAREKAADAGKEYARDYPLAHPRMYGEPPLERGPLAGKTVPLQAMVGMYRKAFGWDERSGSPLPETLKELGVPI